MVDRNWFGLTESVSQKTLYLGLKGRKKKEMTADIITDILTKKETKIGFLERISSILKNFDKDLVVTQL